MITTLSMSSPTAHFATAPIECRLAATLPDVHLPAGGAARQLTSDIQWMPPGEHEITALQGGRAITTRVAVNERTALVVAGALRSFLSRAASGAGDRPYFDFNHEDAEASGHLVGIYWAGNDPVKGGVRARVQWTEPGRAALLGRAYRRFSPSFFVNSRGEVTGVPVNMGGLVNRAAFQSIQPIWSRAAEPPGQPNPKGTMQETPPPNSPQPIADPAQELADLRATVTLLASRVAALEAQSRQAPPADGTVDENDPVALKTRLAALENQMAVQARETALASVTAAIRSGKLPPQAGALHARWVEAIAAHPDLAGTLAALPVNAAFAKIVHAGSGGASANQTAANSGEHEFLVQARAVATARQLKPAEAIAILAREQPALYQQYRQSLAAR